MEVSVGRSDMGAVLPPLTLRSLSVSTVPALRMTENGQGGWSS